MRTLLFFFLFPVLSYAGPYYEQVISTTAGTSTMTISGYIGVAASSTTPTTYKFRIDGPGGYLQFPDGTKQTVAASNSAVYDTARSQIPLGNVALNAFHTIDVSAGVLIVDSTTATTEKTWFFATPTNASTTGRITATSDHALLVENRTYAASIVKPAIIGSDGKLYLMNLDSDFAISISLLGD